MLSDDILLSFPNWKKNKKTNQKHFIESEICLLNLIKIVEDDKQIHWGRYLEKIFEKSYYGKACSVFTRAILIIIYLLCVV